MTIVSFEGLGNLGCVERGLIEPLQKKFKFEYIRSSYKAMPKAVEGAIVIGHSFGGDPALLYGARNKARAIFTIDPRKVSLLPSLKAKLFPFKRPAGVPLVMNYYQTSFLLPGAPVVGADVNTVVRGYIHGNMPRYPEIYKVIEGLLV